MSARQHHAAKARAKAAPLLVEIEPAIKADAVELCSVCHGNPRAGRGASLRRCLPCIRKAAEADRLAREEAQRRHISKLLELKPDKPVKTCRTCHSMRPLEAFAKHRLSKDGHQYHCKSCVAVGRKRKRPVMSPEQIEADRRRRAEPHRRESNLAAVVRWQANHPEAGHARRALKRAVKIGAVTPAACCEAKGCTEERVQGHHSSYKQARRATWLCASHHRRAHAGHRVPLKKGGRVRLPEDNT